MNLYTLIEDYNAKMQGIKIFIFCLIILLMDPIYKE